MSKEASEQLVVRLILRHFSTLQDWRVARTRRYALGHLLVMALVASLSGCSWGFKAMAQHVAERRRDFERWLGVALPTTPSPDTFRRLFAALLPSAFEDCMRRFVAALLESLEGEVVALDGQEVLRQARGPDGGPARALQMLHVWASEQRLVLAQEAVAGAPGEPAAAPALLRALALEGAVVTGDANLCTEEVARAAHAGRAHYLLALKGNRGPLHHFAASLCVLLAWGGRLPQRGVRHMARVREHAHGRWEEREAWALSPGAWPVDWPGLRTLLLMRRVRQVPGQPPSEEWHVSISSLAPRARALARAARAHWGVENGLHWCLDVQMGQDRRRVRDGRASQNLARLDSLALQMLKRDTTRRTGIALKRQHAAATPAYVIALLKAGLP